LSLLIGITLSLTLIFGLLPACGGGGASPGATGTGGVAPIAQGKTVRWRYQSNANAGTQTYWLEEEFVQNLIDATGGRLEIELSPQGAIVGSMEIFDAVASGAIESGNS
jgi:TRAP-type mannitol/chloroaromatic compound transport system substrate-binding protein